MFLEYLVKLIAYTLLTIAAFWGMAIYIQRKGMGNPKPTTIDLPDRLRIESHLSLEPRKSLYVVRSGSERFLIATAGDTTQLVARLMDGEPLPEDWPKAVPSIAPPLLPARFGESLRWVLSSRKREG